MTGILLSPRTLRGLARFYWIIAREAATLFPVVSARPGSDPMALVAARGRGTLRDAAFLRANAGLVWTSVIVRPLLIGMVVVSELKPWGKVKAGPRT